MIADKTPLAAAASAGRFVPAETLARIAAAAPGADRSGSFPWEGLRALHEAGLLEATVPVREGGQGAGLATAARILAEVGQADPSVALIASMTLFNPLTQARRSIRPTGVYRALLEQARHQPVLINAARGGIPSTVARKVADGWRISGRKRFVTGSEGLTHFLVWAATDEDEPRVGTFIATAGTPGIEIVRNWDSLGMRATSSHDVVFRDVAVPTDHVINIGPAGQAEQDNRAHAAMTLGLTAIYLGVAEAAQEVFADFARTRIPANLGRPIATTDRIITAAGEIALLTGSARDIIFDALDHRLDDPEALMRARLIAGRNIQKAVQIAVRALGNPALSADLGLELHFRNAQATLVHAPQEDVAISILGRAALARSKRIWRGVQKCAPAPYT